MSPNEESKVIKNIDDVLIAIRNGSIKEHLHNNIELKEDWAQKHGVKISALANKLDQIFNFLVIGVDDLGSLANRDEKWVKRTEEIVSQHINQNLDPVQACKNIAARDIDGQWVLIVTIENPGEVTYWGNHAYQAAGTTVAEMEPDEVLKLRIQLPGLIDYSNQFHRSSYDENLVEKFIAEIDAKGHPLEVRDQRSPHVSALKMLSLHEKQAARILFGRASYRVVVYDDQDEPVSNVRKHGLFGLLLPDFIESLCGHNGARFSRRALKEALANAVAHAAYYESDGDIILEVHPGRLVISNLCLREATYFANRWFSRGHKTTNGLLMESLRLAGYVDELGRGKNLIFSESIKFGSTPPEVQIENAGKYLRWKLTIFGGDQTASRIRIVERCKELYGNDRKALIAVALVFWRDLPVSEIRKYVDSDFAREFAEVLTGNIGPIFYSKEEDRIVLRRWANVLIGEGKNSKALSHEEEEQLLAAARERQKLNHGIITPKDIRDLAAMGNTASERVLSSHILAKWLKEGIVEKRGVGKYALKPHAGRLSRTSNYEQILQRLVDELGSFRIRAQD